MAAVTIKNLTKSYDGVQVLKELNVRFQDGEFVTLLGPSGCGKTTILRLLAGFEQPSSGEIWIGDTLVSGGKTLLPPEKRNIGMVFQSYAVWPHMTVEENAAYPLRIRRMPKAETAERVEAMLRTVHLDQYAKRLPSQLSGGQQQRVALARALLAEPSLLLLDEPLSNLDAKLRESMRFEIKEIQKKTGITVVYVTHDQTEAMAMSDRIFLIHRGIVQQSGSPAEIYDTPNNQFVADFLGKVDFFKGKADNGRIVFPDMGGQSVPYDGPRTGKVDVAVRPENIYFDPDGPLEGVLERQYYLGDVDDCRVRIGKSLVRVIANGYEYRSMKDGQKVLRTILHSLSPWQRLLRLYTTISRVRKASFTSV